MQESHFENQAEFKENPKKIVTRAILVNEQGKVLLGKRVRGGGVGKWALVGGKPDNNETPEHAVVREVKEELGVDFSPTLFEILEDQQSKDRAENEPQAWDVYVYSGNYSGSPIYKPDEISELITVDEEELKDLDIAFNHREILERFFNQK